MKNCSEAIFEIPLRDVERDRTDTKDTNKDIVPVSKFRVMAAHSFALVAIIMFKLSQGFSTGFTIILIHELRKADAEVKVSFDELTWFSSYYFTPPIGAILGGFLTQCIGCRKLLQICGILYVISGLMFYWSPSAFILLSAQVIVGFIDGMLKGPCYTYLAEVSLPQFRGIFMSCIELSSIIAIFASTTVGTFLHWRILALVKTTIATLALILICFVPESPYWLASKNRHDDANRSLAWLRGWTTVENVKAEMDGVIGSLSKESPPAKSVQELFCPSSGRIERLKELMRQCSERSFYFPFVTILFVFAALNLDGLSSLTTFSILVFHEIDSPVDPHLATIAMSVIRILGSLACTAFINVAGKRRLLFMTLVSSGVVLTVAGAFGYATHDRHISSAVYHWIPIVSILTAVFSNSLGLDKISYILNSEIFPLRTRHIGVGAGLFINTLLNSIMNKCFLYLVAAISMSGTLLCFAAGNVIGCIGIYYLVPETEGKSLKEIEEQYASAKSLVKVATKK